MSVPTLARTDSYQYNSLNTECKLLYSIVEHLVLLTPTQACPFHTGKDGSSVLMPIASSSATNWLHRGCSLQQSSLTRHHTTLPTAGREHCPDLSGDLASLACSVHLLSCPPPGLPHMSAPVVSRTVLKDAQALISEIYQYVT